MFLSQIPPRAVIFADNFFIKEFLLYFLYKTNPRLLIVGKDKASELASKFHLYAPIICLSEREIEVKGKISKSEFLFHIFSEEPFVGTLFPSLLTQSVLSIEKWRQMSIQLEANTEVDQQELIENLIENGYARTNIIVEKGEISRKGSTVEVFPPHTTLPIRIDFDGDTVRKIYNYDPLTGLPVENLDHITLPPVNCEGNTPLIEVLPEEILFVIYDFMEFYQQDTSEDVLNAINHCKKLLIFSPYGTEKLLEKHFSNCEFIKLYTETFDPDEFMKKRGRKLHLLNFWLKNKIYEGYRIILSHTTNSGRKKIEDFLSTYKLNRITYRSPISIENFLFEKGIVEKTFKIILFPFERKIKIQEGEWNYDTAPEDFSPGDYVVHEEHGVGIYRGIVEKEISGKKEPLLAIEYRNHEFLYLPFTQVNKLKKYRTGSDEVPPNLKVDKLGGESWEKKKRSALKKIDQIALKLLEKYSRRFTVKREPYEINEEWLSILSETFEYEETHDQKIAIQEIINDMKKPYPMERLICGDVGYGKTEIAVRSACISAMNGRQVAVLVPTTVLAEQHFRIFTERLRDFPLKIAKLNRFVDKGEKLEIMEEVSEGKIDILIGTHVLLDPKLKFKNPGLLIIDEEHRFGVSHKDIRGLFPENMDVLYITATPIPRTLQLALSGLRDISRIETPPTGRVPVKTFIVHYDEDILKNACEFELNRGGQIFFVHNVINDLGKIEETLKKLLPSARIAVLHGKMSGKKIDETMLRYLHGQIDVLISTTIIGFGIDIPGANTIIINNANNFGLSDLYHLRGRVGRRNEQGFAYLFIPPHKPLTESALKRLRAFASVLGGGKGYHLARKDLEIRGSGNLLGKEQWGHIYELGFEYYMKLLEERTKQLLSIESGETQIDIKISADEIIPTSYIPETGLRMKYFFRFLNVKKIEEIEALKEELEKTWGKLPEITGRFLRILAMKITGWKRGLSRIILFPDRIMIEYRNGRRSISPLRRIAL